MEIKGMVLSVRGVKDNKYLLVNIEGLRLLLDGGHDVQRGDVVTLDVEYGEGKYYVRRVINVEGDSR